LTKKIHNIPKLANQFFFSHNFKINLSIISLIDSSEVLLSRGRCSNYCFPWTRYIQRIREPKISGRYSWSKSQKSRQLWKMIHLVSSERWYKGKGCNIFLPTLLLKRKKKNMIKLLVRMHTQNMDLNCKTGQQTHIHTWRTCLANKRKNILPFLQ